MTINDVIDLIKCEARDCGCYARILKRIEACAEHCEGTMCQWQETCDCDCPPCEKATARDKAMACHSLKSRNAALVDGLRMMADLCCRNNHPHLEGRGGGATCMECQQARELLKAEEVTR